MRRLIWIASIAAAMAVAFAVVALQPASVTSVFKAHLASAAVLGIENTAVVIDPATGDPAPAGIVGDTLTLTATNIATSGATYTATFTAANNTTVTGSTPVLVKAATTSGGPSTFTTTVPATAITGQLTLSDGTNTATGNFQLWVSHSEPYVMPTGHINITEDDLSYILDQIKFAEAHAARTQTSATTLASKTATRTITYPYDVTSTSRCLTAADVNSVISTTSAAAATATSGIYAFGVDAPWGLRQVDGQCNNISNVQPETPPTTVSVASGAVLAQPQNAVDTAQWGAADFLFPRLTAATNNSASPAPYPLTPSQAVYATHTNGTSLTNPTTATTNQLAYISDPTSRIISNLISDQSDNNPAAVAASTSAYQTLYGTLPAYSNSVNATTGAVSRVMSIPNITPDYNVSAGFNSWFTLFGQFFDHGLDLIPKAGPSVYIPLQQSDPLYSPMPGQPNFMILTRASDPTGNSINTTTPYIDQSQSYGSHPAQNFFLREYAFAPTTGIPLSDGRLLAGTDTAYNTTTGLPTAWSNNLTIGGTLTQPGGTNAPNLSNDGMPTWRDMKAQSRLLGFKLTDYDVPSIPIVATDQYGNFIPNPTVGPWKGMPMMLFTNGTQYVWASGTAANPIATGAKQPASVAGTSLANSSAGVSGTNWVAVSSGHVFINDTMASAVPFDASGNPLQPDADTVMNSPLAPPITGYYDNEALNAHFIAGDGRINENIGLEAVHATFHSEHNLLVKDIQDFLAKNPALAPSFVQEWDPALHPNRLYQAARFVMEMEYQHMVFDEFARRIAPSLPVFISYDTTLNSDISAEFASAVYRLGHSMLDETIARANPGKFYDPNNNQDVPLIGAFTNPPQVRLPRPAIVDNATYSGGTFTFNLASGETPPPAGSIVTISGMTDTTYDISNAVVATSNGTSQFTVTSRYPGGATGTTVAAGTTTFPAGLAPSTTSIVAAKGPSTFLPVSGSLDIARVAINDPGTNGYSYSPMTAAAMTAQGMSSQRGNEVDEFVTDAVRNNLLGLPLDLASLNMTRGRDTGLPTLNQFRAQHASALPPYTSWTDFISHMRYTASGVNFVAAYGTYPTLSAPVNIGTISAAAFSGSTVTYTCTPACTGVTQGEEVTISGLTNDNIANAVVATVGAGSTSFTVTSAFAHGPRDVVAYPTQAGLTAGNTAQPLVTGGFVARVTGASGAVTRAMNTQEQRAAAQAILTAAATPGTPQYDFMNSVGTWAGKETGLNYVDLWTGGLAENPAKQPVTPPLLGPTFQYVFMDQMLKDQNGDRFYYLGRIVGLNLGEEIPQQKFTDIVRRNTPSASPTLPTSSATGIIGMNSPGFGVSDCAFSTNMSLVPADQQCPSRPAVGNTTPAETTGYTADGTLTHTGVDNVTGFADPSSTTGVKIHTGFGDDGAFGGPGNDVLTGDLGGDLLDGGAGNDVLLGGPGEDLIKGGAGNDTINAGDSQLGDVADGGSGSDFIHCGNCSGAVVSLIGEAGDDFIQGGQGSDLEISGGEGNDWVEGGAGTDIIYGDSPYLTVGSAALNNGCGCSISLAGGDDVIDGGPGDDLEAGGGGDDIFNLGAGIDGADGGPGFNWVNYQNNTRSDNGGSVPNAWIDLTGGTFVPAAGLNAVGDSGGYLSIQAASGSPGPDNMFGSNAADTTATATGTIGGTTVRITGTVPTLVDGMLVSGTGIAKDTRVVKVTLLVTGGVTVTQVTLSGQITANINGTLTFSTVPLTNPNLITGLAGYLQNSPAWKQYANVNPSAHEWSGGSILFGGDGNDNLESDQGQNVIDGSASVHTCILAKNGTYSVGADTVCNNVAGYSSMTPLAPLMDAGALQSSDLTTVREIQQHTFAATTAATTGTSRGFTVTNGSFYPNESVSVTGCTSSITNGVVSSTTAPSPATVDPTGSNHTPIPHTQTVTVTGTFTAGTGTNCKMQATDTLMLSGAQTAYSVVAIPTNELPAGATSGFTIQGANGVDTVYDVQMVAYSVAGGIQTPGQAVRLVATGTALTGLTVSTGTISPAFDQATYSYNVTVPSGTTSLTVTPTVTSPATVTVNGAVATQSVALAAFPASIPVVVTKGTATTTYTLNVGQAGWVSTFGAVAPNSTGFSTQIANYDATYTYACSIVVSGVVSPVGSQPAACAVSTTGLVTATGMITGQQATVTVSTSKAGYLTGTANVTGTPGASTGLNPTFSGVTKTTTSFATTVSNWDSTYTWSCTATVGTCALGTGSGTTMSVTVSGLLAGQKSTVTVTTVKAGVTGTASVASYATPVLPALGAWTRSVTTSTVAITNYATAWTWTCKVTSGTCVVTPATATTATVTVTDTNTGTNTLTVTKSQTGYQSSSATASG